MRILKFIGAFVAAFILIILIVFGFNFNALFTLYENQDGIKEGQQWVEKTYSLKGLTEYIGAQPQRVSVASIAIENPDSSIMYNPHTPRTMGRLANIFTLIEYARQVEAGTLNPDEDIPLDEVNRFQLPYIDQSDHESAMETLREQGKIYDNDTIALKDLVQTAIEFNDIAIADYLFLKIGPQNVEDLYDRLSIEETELPLPFSGLYIMLSSNQSDSLAKVHLDSLSQLPREDFRNLVFRKTRRLNDDKSYREKIVAQFRKNEGLGLKFIRQRNALAFFPKTTAHEMSGLMKQIQQETLISSSVSNKVKTFLDWPLKNDNSRLNKDFTTYGALYDNRMGMVNGIDYGKSSYSKEPFAQAVFFDDLQIAFWFHMSSNLMHQDFEQRLIWDPALREATVNALRQSNQPKKTSE
jgi:hypothetical protein